MCGLVGIINREEFKQPSDKLIKYFNQALFMDTVRGKHGTGVTAVDTLGTITTYKKAMAAPDFLDLKHTQSILSIDSNVFLSGHNRWATQGAHTDENSHPFRHSHITMFHNGTLDSVTDLPNGNKFTVDSDAIAYSLSEVGTVKTLENLDGAFALVWYDSVNESINFARNKERPLWFGHLEKSNSMVYASEKAMVEWLTDRNNINIEKMIELPVGKHVEIFLDTEQKTINSDFTPKPSGWEGYYPGYDYGPSTYAASAAAVGRNVISSYTDMPAIGETITVEVDNFVAYQGTKITPALYGTLNCTYKINDKEYAVKFNGITIATSDKFLGEFVTGVVTTITPSIQCNCIMVKEPVGDIIADTHFDATMTDLIEDLQVQRFGPNSTLISQKEYDELTKHGCVCCGANILDSDDSSLHWDHQKNAYCEDCQLELYA